MTAETVGPDWLRALGGGHTGGMIRQGPLSVTMHSLAEPLLVVILLAAPFLLGFDDVGAATAVSIVAGILILVVAMSTAWRLSLVKVIPLLAHATADLLLGTLLVASPFLFGFSDESTVATAFFMAFGITEILATLGTRWVAEDQTVLGATRRPAH